MQRITNWSDAIIASLAQASSMFFAAVPRILGFAIILIVGWILASLIGKAVSALLRAVHFDALAQRSGLTGFIRKSHINDDAAGSVGMVAKWFVRLITLVAAFDALGLPAVSQILHQLLLWLPNLVVALMALVIGGIAANALRTVVLGTATEGGLKRPDFLARLASYAVWGFAIIVAINQLGIATALINILLMAAAGAVALALGLSFGLGARDTAAAIVRRWYDRGQAAGPHIRRASDAANQSSLLHREAGAERRSLVADRRSAGT